MNGDAAGRGIARVRMQSHGSVPVMTIGGELDISNIEDVRRVAESLSNLSHGLVIDLRELEYIDSTGISLLYELAGRLRQRSQQLVVVCPPDAQPRRVLELTAFPNQAPVLDHLADALATLDRVT